MAGCLRVVVVYRRFFHVPHLQCKGYHMSLMSDVVLGCVRTCPKARYTMKFYVSNHAAGSFSQHNIIH